MNLQRNNQRRQAGVKSGDNLTSREKVLMDAWENADPEFLAGCRQLNIGPDFGRNQSGAVMPAEDHAPYAPAALHDWHEQENREHWGDEPTHDMVSRADLQEAILRVLYTLCNARHPKLRLATDCLIAIINKSDETCQAAIGRKHGLTRAAISKRLRDMRSGEYLEELEVYYFGGRPEVAKSSKARAIRVHKELEPHKKKCKMKPSPYQLARQFA